MKRIKKLSQRLQNGTFSAPFPIGADALNIDMLSGNNLEEEMHLGSPSMTSFNIDANNQMIITEEYKKEDTQTENYHIMVTTFEVQNEEMVIIQKLYFVKTAGQQDLKKTKTVIFESSNNNLKIKEVIV